MNKLKLKIFTLLTLILTLFLLTILIIFNFQDYKKEERAIKENLNRVNNIYAKPIDRNFENRPMQYTNDNKIFMDSKIYTVLIDNNKNILNIITHTDETSSYEKIEKTANNIIKSGSKSKIGNLYISDFAHSYKDKNTLIIMDTQNIRLRLIASLYTSFVIFVILEVIIVFVCNKITNWLIKPVIDTFNKQKQFIEDASHELKTPISVIVASAESLEHDNDNKKWINIIKSESDRMNNLICNLLDLASLQNKNDINTFKEQDISKLVEMSVLTFEALMYENNIKLDYEIAPKILFSCDENQIKQLVAILLDNAIKHSVKNGNIIVNLRDDKKDIILEVKNKGEMIPKEIQDKIFERFYRANEARTTSENRYGLGLSIAKNIVINHNGKIFVNSDEEFTTFKVILKNK